MRCFTARCLTTPSRTTPSWRPAWNVEMWPPPRRAHGETCWIVWLEGVGSLMAVWWRMNPQRFGTFWDQILLDLRSSGPYPCWGLPKCLNAGDLGPNGPDGVWYRAGPHQRPCSNVGVRVGDLLETGPDACMPSILGNLHIQMATTRGFSLARSDSYFFFPLLCGLGHVGVLGQPAGIAMTPWRAEVIQQYWRATVRMVICWRRPERKLLRSITGSHCGEVWANVHQNPFFIWMFHCS